LILGWIFRKLTISVRSIKSTSLAIAELTILKDGSYGLIDNSNALIFSSTTHARSHHGYFS
ncbi:MAG: hypothetical protein AAGA66_20675, partial [Bacteroidota bacterium]